MSVLQVSNIHFESSGNTRIQIVEPDQLSVTTGGSNVVVVNSTSFKFAVSGNDVLTANSSFFNFKVAGANVISSNSSIGTHSVGYVVTGVFDGSKSAGTYTPSPLGGNIRKITNDGAFTLAAPSFAGDYTMIVKVTNGASAGAITPSGFLQFRGSSLTTTNGAKFNIHITKIDSDVSAFVEAL